jgi:hypothetical protein
MDAEQQGRELRAILEEENPARVLKMLSQRGLLGGLDRKLGFAKIPYDHFARIRAAVRNVPGGDVFLLNFNCLVEKLGSADRGRLAQKILRYPPAIKSSLNLERDARKLAHALSSSKAAKNSYVLTLLSGVPQYLLLYLLVYYPQAKIQSRVKNFLFKFPQLRAKLPRAELQAMGMPPGPKFEDVLERVFLDQLDGKIRTHPQMVSELRALSGIKEPPPQPASPAAARARRAKQRTETGKGKAKPPKA